MSKEYYKIGIDLKGFEKDSKRAQQEFRNIGETAVTQGRQIDKSIRSISTGIATYFSGRELIHFGKEIISVRGEFQGLQLAFETMLGSKQKADKMMSDVVNLAAKTPYTLTEVANNTKQLMAMGIASDNVMDTLKSLGDVAAGVNVPISRLAVNYGQVATMGKLQTRELQDFALAGVPLIEELAKAFNKTKFEIQDMVSAGQIGFKDVEGAFKSMSSDGGKFANMMGKQNNTVTGQISNLQDKIEVMMNLVGEANDGFIYKGISSIANLVAHYEDIVDILKVIITTYGSYKAVLITTKAIQKASITAGDIRAWFQLTKGIKTAKDAQIAFNLATKANPLGLVIAGITTLISIITIFKRRQKEAREEVEKGLQPLRDKYRQTNELIGKLKEANTTEEERKTILEKLKDVNPDIVKGIKDESDAIKILSYRLRQYNTEQLASMNVKEFSITNGFSESFEDLGESKDKLDKEKNNIVGTYTELFNRFTDLKRKNSNIPKNVNSLFDSIFGSNVDVSHKVETLFSAYEDVRHRINARAGRLASSPEQRVEERSIMSLFANLNISGYKKKLKRFDKMNDKFVLKKNELKKKIQDVGNAIFANNEKQKQGWINSQLATYFPDENKTNNVLLKYKDLFKKVDEYTEQQLYETKVKLTELLGTGLGDNSDEKIKAQIDNIIDYLNKPRNFELIAQTKEQIKEAQAELDKLSLPNAIANLKKKKELSETIRGLKAQLETLTGVTKKEPENQKKSKDERLRALQEFADQEFEIRQDIEQSKVDAMKEGSEKSLAQLKINHQQEITELEKQKQNYIKKQKAVNKNYTGFSNDEEYMFATIKTNVLQKQRLEIAKFYKNIFSNYQTYADSIKETNEKYNSDKQLLINAGASNESITELERQRYEKINEISQFFAERSEEYQDYIAGLASMSLEALEAELANAQKILLAKTEGKSDTNNTKKIAELRAKITALKQQIKTLTSTSNGTTKEDNPENSTKKWKMLQEELRAVADEFDNIESVIGGTVGEIIQSSGQIATWTIQMINGITQLTQWSITSTKLAAQGASESIIAVEKASVILAIISAAMQIATKIYTLLKGKSESQIELERLQGVSKDIQSVGEQINKLYEKRIELIKEATAAEAGYLNTIAQENIQSGLDYYNKLLDSLSDTTILHAPGHGKKNDYTLQQLMDDLDISAYQEFIEWWDSGALYDYMLNENEDIKNEDYWNEIFDAYQNLLDASKKLAEAEQEASTGISFDDFKDNLDDLVQDVETTADDITNSFTDTIEKGILNWVKTSYLNEAMQKWYDRLALAYSDDNMLTSDEYSDLDTLYKNIYDRAQSMYDTAAEAAGINLDSSVREASSKGFASMSQDSADELNGRFTAIQGYTLQINNNVKILSSNSGAILNHLAGIHENTNELNRLQTIEKGITGMKRDISDIRLKGVKVL